MTIKAEKLDAHGRTIVDDDDVLKDGQRLRVPMLMLDGASGREQLQARAEAVAGHPVFSEGRTDAQIRRAALRSRFGDEAVRDRTDDAVAGAFDAITTGDGGDDAYAAYSRSLADAWRPRS